MYLWHLFYSKLWDQPFVKEGTTIFCIYMKPCTDTCVSIISSPWCPEYSLWSDEKIIVLFLLFWHEIPHSSEVFLWVHMVFWGSFSRKNIVEELSTDPQIQKSLLMAPVYLYHVMGYVIIRHMNCTVGDKIKQFQINKCSLQFVPWHTLIFLCIFFSAFVPLLIFITFHIVAPPIFSELPTQIYMFLRIWSK